ncbi:acyl-CoA thioesterase [Carboxylicivirga sp. A043]|uniref:acyl-CoA thioesterase n=1 Tax=Carboxylicivirga litoralis TaxID=2816963 RepID=UPI0021CB5441|nr:hotdog domain-containing protein [Carboxylicivirga sp. A043]MCU4157302.1 acyl-CoA thioesterase [Carboxylicivirga sp. A043]
MEEFFNISETRICKAIFPETLNANNSLFGGKAMQWMDEAAYISATRFTRQRMFTANTTAIKFLKAVKPNSIIEVVARVIKAGAVRLTIQVQIFTENMYNQERELAIESNFIMVSLNDENQPQRIDYSLVHQL